MRSYAIGLDIGITSVGWATLALDGNEKSLRDNRNGGKNI